MPPSSPSRQRICLFGGTFDPIHCAHLTIATVASDSFRLDRVLFIPAGTPPHKSGNGVTAYEDRLKMVELACQPYPRFEASRLEERTGRSYTIDTVKAFKENLPVADELFFLIGADAFDDIETWKNWRELTRLIEFIVVTRPGDSYHVPPGARVLSLNGLELPVSSSSIRARLAEGQPTPELPQPVRDYIERRKLYRFGEKPTASL